MEKYKRGDGNMHDIFYNKKKSFKNRYLDKDLGNRIAKKRKKNTAMQKDAFKESMKDLAKQASKEPIIIIKGNKKVLEDESFDIIEEMFAIFISMNVCCRQEIDQVYNKRKSDYEESYEKLIHESYGIIELMDINTVNYARKLFGILKCQKEYKNQILNIETIVKQINPSIVKYVKKSPDVDVPAFMERYYDRRLNTIETMAIHISLFYLAIQYDKMIICEDEFEHLFNTFKAFGEFSDFQEEDVSLQAIMEIENSTEDIVMRTEINRYNPSSYMELLYTLAYDNKELNFEFCSDLLELLTFSAIKNDVSLVSVLYTPIDKCQVKHVLDLYSLEINKARYNGDELDIYDKSYVFTSIIVTVALSQWYYEIKHSQLDSHADKIKELKQITDNLKVKEKELNDLSAENDMKLAKLKKENEELRNSNKNLNSSIAKLEGELAKRDKQISKLLKEKASLEETNSDLEEIITKEMQRKAGSNPELTTAFMLDYINKYKIAMFGGHDSTNLQLKNSIKNFTSFNHSVNIDISAANNADFIFINTQWFNHSLYKMVIPICREKNIPHSYIVGVSSNFASTVEQMYNFILEYEKSI